VVAEDLAFPNGMAVTADNSTLIVAESYGNRLTAFTIAADGGLSDRRVWAETGDDHPDGICIDPEGAVWYGDIGNRRCVRVRKGGEILEVVELDRGCFACMLGGDDGRELFMVTREWRGMEAIDPSQRTGQVVVAQAPVPTPAGLSLEPVRTGGRRREQSDPSAGGRPLPPRCGRVRSPGRRAWSSSQASVCDHGM
jgi:sugar lactone lactonase YvrE